MALYSVYGVTLKTDIPFRSPLPPSSNLPDLLMTETRGSLHWDGAQLLATIPEEYRDPINIESAYRLDVGDLLCFPDGDQALLQREQITYFHAGTERTRADFVDARLLGSVFAWWLLGRGQIPFHAGAVLVDEGAVLFIGEKGTGKSSLISSLVGSGVPLLSDDFVAVHLSPDGTPVAAAAYPQMRVWPETIERFVGSASAYLPVFDDGVKRRVGVGAAWGTFLEGLYPVTRIYLLQRQTESDGAVTVRRCTGHEAFMRLLTALLMSANFPVTELEPVWSDLQHIAERVPVLELRYPSGWQWMGELHRAILEPSHY
jgi:hypothetical protein